MNAPQKNLDMEPTARIDGVRLILRLVELSDAEYIHGLRTNCAYNQHLSPVTGSALDQLAWIEQYKLREAAGQEYYYVILRRDDHVACGTVRLYDIKDGQFTWGSWILDENKPPKAALESACLTFGMAFETLRMKLGRIDVRKDNLHAIEFYRRFNMTEVERDQRNIYFEYSSDRYYSDIQKHLMTIE